VVVEISTEAAQTLKAIKSIDSVIPGQTIGNKFGNITIPKEWRVDITYKGKGVKFYDPTIPNKATSIRVMHPTTKPFERPNGYIAKQINGQRVDINNIPVDKNSSQSHFDINPF
jgi:hypothetical protein